MANERLVKKIYSSTAGSTRRRSRLQKRWIDAVRDMIKAWDISDEDATGLIWDWMQWEYFVYRGGANRDVVFT